MSWFRDLGFSTNPLDIRPNPKLIGLDTETKKLVNHISKGEICFLNGLTGSGKSSLLNKVQKEMKGYKFVYLDAQDLPKNFNLEEELGKKKSFFDMLVLRKFPKKQPVLLIDEFQDTDKNLVLEARSKWEASTGRKIKSIVIAQIDKHLKNVTPSFKERIGNRIITLPTLTDGEMKEILSMRLFNGRENHYKKLHNEALNLLVTVADGNPRRLLEYTDSIFDFHHRKFGEHNPIVKSPTYLVTYYAAREILETLNVNVDAYKYLGHQERERRVEKFEKKFNKPERDVLLYMLTSPRTVAQLATKIKVSESTARKRVSDLKKKGALESAGMRKNQKLYRATEHVKRLTVRV